MNPIVHLKTFSVLLISWSLLILRCDSKFDVAEVFGSYSDVQGPRSHNRHSSRDQHHQQQQHQQQLQHQQGSPQNEQKPSTQIQSVPATLQPPQPLEASPQLQTATDLAVYPQYQTGHSNVPLYLYNPGLARKIGLSTLMMGGVLYGLSLIPALLALSGTAPFGALFRSLGKRRKRRSSPLDFRKRYYFREMPYMNKDSTVRILSMLENTMEMRKIDTPVCKKHFLCKIYRKAILSEDEPLTLATFERAIIDTFGIAAERKNFRIDLIPTVKSYYEAAIVGITGSNCSRVYPCSKKAKNVYMPKTV